MTRRARHLNARHAGAGLVLDARRLTGLNDGDAVSTWADVSGNGWDATSSSTQRPLYKTSIQGGQPVLRFDGSNDILSCAAAGAKDYTKDKGYIYAFFVLKDSAPTSGDSNHEVLFISTTAFASRTTVRSRHGGVSQLVFTGRRLDADIIITTASAGDASSFCTAVARQVTSSGVASISKSGAVTATSAFASSGNTSNTTSAFFNIGSGSAGGSRLNGDIGFLSIIASQLSASLIKRLDHSAAFSFKIQCL